MNSVRPGAGGYRAMCSGANGNINVALIGVGGRGNDLLDWVMKTGRATKHSGQGGRGVGRLREAFDQLLKKKPSATDSWTIARYSNEKTSMRSIIATPDHWHARMAIEAMDKGKDVYLEKPMTHTVEEAKRVYEKVKSSGRVLQVGSQTTSSDQWWKARKAIQDGMIGKLIMSQGSYHRNSTGGEWNWKIDPAAGPDGKGDDFHRLEDVARRRAQAKV